jgi:hypothetical protein
VHTTVPGLLIENEDFANFWPGLSQTVILPTACLAACLALHNSLGELMLKCFPFKEFKVYTNLCIPSTKNVLFTVLIIATKQLLFP